MADAELRARCERLRSLHTPGDPLLLPNVWDIPTARTVVAAGFPVVATTSWGVAASIGEKDDEQAPGDAMLAAAARIAASVDVPVTVDAESGYGMTPADLVRRLHDMGAAGCNLEETDHSSHALHDPSERAEWLAEVRAAASRLDYPLVINARVDGWLAPYVAGTAPGAQIDLVADAIERARMYVAAGADCVYPIALWESDALSTFLAEVAAPTNISMVPQLRSVDAVAALGVARLSWAIFLYEGVMAHFRDQLASLRG